MTEFSSRVEIKTSSLDGTEYVVMTKEMYDKYKKAFDQVESRNSYARTYMRKKYNENKVEKQRQKLQDKLQDKQLSQDQVEFILENTI